MQPMTDPLALIITDDGGLAGLSQLILEGAGTEIIILDSRDALSGLPEVMPVHIVLDLDLRHVSGEELLSQIRANDRLARTGIILVTDDAARAEPLRQEGYLVLLKPFTPSQLRDCLRGGGLGEFVPI